MFPKKRRFFFLILAVVLCLLAFLAFFGLRQVFRLSGGPDLAGLTKGRLGQGITFRHFSVQDSLLVLDSITIGRAIRVGQVSVNKDVYGKLQTPGAQAADFAFKNASLPGFLLETGRISVRMIGQDTFEVNIVSGVPGDSGKGRVTASGRFGNCRAFPLTSTDFQAEAPGFKVAFDSLVITREGLSRGSVRATASPEEFRGMMESPLPARGKVNVRAGFSFKFPDLEADGIVTADTLEVKGLALRSLRARFSKQGDVYRFPEYTAKAFGGSGNGSAEFADDPAEKKAEIILDLKNADLNLMPRKPSGLAFEGRFNGRMTLSGKGRTWQEVLRKLKSD
jgi:hypothetical protein